jgi:hypothetical protein
MRRSTAIASIALTAGLTGGATGAILGFPGLSGAQTATTDPPAQQTPAQHQPGQQDAPRDGPKRGCHHKGRGLEAAATTLDMSLEDLRAQLRNGSTIAAVARSKGVDVQKVIDAMVADANRHIDEAVAEGKLTAEQGAQKKQDAPARITRLVNEGRPERPGGPRDGPRPPA